MGVDLSSMFPRAVMWGLLSDSFRFLKPEDSVDVLIVAADALETGAACLCATIAAAVWAAMAVSNVGTVTGAVAGLAGEFGVAVCFFVLAIGNQLYHKVPRKSGVFRRMQFFLWTARANHANLYVLGLRLLERISRLHCVQG